MSNRASKGSAFERELCKLLSKWWTGDARDDVFWRSSQSGGRATQRAKQGLRTHGSYGDIAAVDPIGEPLLKVFTIELKRGNSHGTPWDLLESKPDSKPCKFEQCLQQAVRSAEQAGSVGWMLILRRDRRPAVACVDQRALKHIGGQHLPIAPRLVRFRVDVSWPGSVRILRFVVLPLEDLLQSLSPDAVRGVA